MFEITDVFKSFSDKDVLRGASLSVKNKSAALMGESGSGKTTILRIIASLEKVDSGSVNVSGKTAVAFSEPRLFDKFRVMENVTCVMPKTVSKAEKEARARKLLTDLLLEGAERMYPRELSSGMAARVAIARALAFDADNILLDEPLRALDDETKKAVIDVLKKELLEKSVLIITHDCASADALCSETFVLANGKITKKNKDPG